MLVICARRPSSCPGAGRQSRASEAQGLNKVICLPHDLSRNLEIAQSAFMSTFHAISYHDNGPIDANDCVWSPKRPLTYLPSPLRPSTSRSKLYQRQGPATVSRMCKSRRRCRDENILPRAGPRTGKCQRD